MMQKNLEKSDQETLSCELRRQSPWQDSAQLKPDREINKMNDIGLECITCKKVFQWNRLDYHCDCAEKALLAVKHHKIFKPDILNDFESRRLSKNPIDESGVWRFREAVLPLEEKFIVTHPEGNTRLYRRESLSQFADLEDLRFKHEGENPSGSFKDRGMTVAVSIAKKLGAKILACASTGNTSAALAAYAAQAGLSSVVFLPAGKISLGKLAQAKAYGARCLSIRGDFDAAMELVHKASQDLGFYLVNSLNPFRLEGQKTIIWEMLQQLDWKVPDWIVVPGGNLGNTSAFGKAIREAYDWGWINKIPRIAVIQASGANPFLKSFRSEFREFHPVHAETVATAIRIGNPVNYQKAVTVMQDTVGVVEDVTDEEILAAKTAIDRSGLGCEPASACTLAGIKKLRLKNIMKRHDVAVAVLTGNILKDTDIILNQHSGEKTVEEISCDISEVRRVLGL